MRIPPELEATQIDLKRFRISSGDYSERYLHDLAGCFADEDAYAQACQAGNPLVYSVSSVTPAEGDGDLHYGLGMIMPGRVGDEYFLTRGHLHSRRAAAEVYIGLGGAGIMLLEDERDGDCRARPLRANSVVYVPGYTAHRTINVGDEPLTYLGIYPADAGHDYGALRERNFEQIVVARDGQPVVIQRQR